ncbi:MAG: metalloprotease [Planctomycetaceae bacterium]
MENLPSTAVCSEPRSAEQIRFLEALQNTRNYLSGKKPEIRPHESSSTAPAAFEFSLRRVLRLVKWSVVAFALLLIVSTLFSTGNPTPAVLVLFVGLAYGFVVLLRSLRNARTAASVKAAELAAVEASRIAQYSDAVTEDPPFVPADDKFPLKLDDTTLTAAPISASRIRRWLTFAISLSVWIAVAALSLPDLTPTLLVLVIVLHEFGHFIAMYLLGYTNLGMFFIPFFAGAVTGTRAGETPGDRLIMLLSGPAPGLLLGCAIYWIDTRYPLATLRLAAIWLVAINLLNLLPVWPLDGGRICWALFARHSALAQTALTLCTFAGLIFLLFVPQGNLVRAAVILAGLVLLLGPSNYRDASASLIFHKQFPDTPATLQQLSERQLWELYRLTTASKRHETGTSAMQMMNIWNRVAQLPKSTPKLRYLLIYTLLWLIPLMTAAGTKLQSDARHASAALSTLLDALLPE